MISRAVVDLLVAAFGPVQPTSLPVFVSRTVITVMLFLAYELGYWLNHYLSHRIPFLWEFHKVHHSRDGVDAVDELSRPPGLHVHILQYSRRLHRAGEWPRRLPARQSVPQYGLSETNIILVFFIYFYVHLQHTQLWISFTGWLGHLFMSPRASSNSSLARSGPLQQKSGKLPGAVGLDIRHPVCSRAAFGKA